MQEMNKLYQLILKIEPEHAFLSEDDQKIFWQYKLACETGEKLPMTAPENIVRMHNILFGQKTVIESVVDPNSTAEQIANAVVAPLTMAQVVKDLMGAKHMLNPQEATFLSIIAEKVKQRMRLTEEEMRALLGVYRKKGF